MKRLWMSMAVLIALFASSLVVSSLVEAQERLHPRVLAAFREVVAEPAKSTVQVYCDGYRSALGAVVREDGYVVTKSSELKGKIQCLLPGRRENEKLDATIAAKDPALDLTVLKIDAKGLTPIAWSDQTPTVGSWLATPGLHADPVSIGVVSVAARKIAAPQGALGISMPTRDGDNEARIEEIVPGKAADKAGLRSGDLILKVNGKEIGNKDQLIETIKSYLPGEKVELLVKRGKEQLTLSAVLGSRAQLFHEDNRSDFQNSLGGPLSERRGGFVLAIQHDSVLRPVDCGGPIVDLDGKAVGLNIARAGRVESYALPASIVKEAVAKLLQTHLTAAPAPAEKAPEKTTPAER